MKTILITGGAGFIGSTLADKLLKDGHKVVAIDNFCDFGKNYGHKEKMNNVVEFAHDHENYTLCGGDILDVEFLESVFQENDIDIIVHLAARAGVRPSIDEPSLYMNVNVVGTSNMLEMAKKYGVNKFLFASSSSVYGNLPEGPFSEDMDITNPASPYAASKAAGEALCRTFTNLNKDMQILCLRFFTVYGPRQRPDLAINKFITCMKADEPITVYGDGTSQRNYTYIDDIVDGIIRCFDYEKKQFDVFNLGGDKTISLSHLIEIIEDKMGQKAKIDRKGMQPGDVQLTHADLTKVRQTLNYEPQTTIEDGIEKFIQSIS